MNINDIKSKMFTSVVPSVGHIPFTVVMLTIVIDEFPK